MKAYKVVYSGPESDNRLVSAFTKNVLYIPGQESFPITDFSRLFCFDNLQDAVNWFLRQKDETRLQIWECGIDGVENDIKDFFVCPTLLGIALFLQGENCHRGSEYTPPKGTLAVKSITLTKEVPAEEIARMRIY